MLSYDAIVTNIDFNPEFGEITGAEIVVQVCFRRAANSPVEYQTFDCTYANLQMQDIKLGKTIKYYPY